jgi:hypothetical protein
VDFYEWVRQNAYRWYSEHDQIVFVRRHGHISELHPLFLGPIHLETLQGVLDAEQEGGSKRMEISVIGHSGSAMKRTFRLLDFHCEGTMLQKVQHFDQETRRISFYDVEMWAKLTDRSA